jgi:hypothetical protein
MKNFKRSIVWLGLGAAAAMSACASKPSSSGEATSKLEDKWKSKIGVARKTDFIEDYGTAEWCRNETSGEETCRFYKKGKTRYLGDGRDKKAVENYDEVVADFAVDGTLKSFKANSQR